MSYKKSTLITLVGIALFGIIYAYSINSMANGLGTTNIGPKYFPNILVTSLLILCVISFIQNLKSEDQKIDINNVGMMVITVLFTVIYFLAWYFTGWFYVMTALFLWALLILFTEIRTLKSIIICLAISVGFTLFTYVIFGQIMMVRF
ncbi:MAG TPA: tripartite tricarboxylate transporter TctB family protein [Ureibacillus sp.]|nr:tripartite tricarboxylate transporter TctB family protein [Ureibacillus sp.]